MPIDMHTIETVDGATPLARPDRLVIAHLPSFPNAGAAEGASVTVTVSGLTLPATYAVHALPSQPAIVSVGSKTNSGFVLTLTPVSSTETLVAGTIDITAVA
jgi:hypothetical protein